MGENHVEVFRGYGAKPTERWYWRIRSSNGQIVSTGGEAYFSAWNAKRAAKKLFPGFEVRKAKF